MQTLKFEPGNTRSAAMLLKSVLVTDFKFSADKASTKAFELARKAKAANANFTSDELLKLTNDELKLSVGTDASTDAGTSKSKSKEKAPKEKDGLTTAQMNWVAKAKEKGESKNAMIAHLIKDSNKYTAIAEAVGVKYQRVKNVKKNEERKAGGGEAPAKVAKAAKPATKKASTKTAKKATSKKK